MSSVDAALLRLLRSTEVHLPRGELARLLEINDRTVSEAVTGLRDAGFEIDERPGLGYRLLAAPDRIIADDLQARLGECRLVREILVFEETDSTNERLLDLGTAGAREGLVLFAERQTAGRGRFLRQWDSASHRGIWVSLLLRPQLPLSLWPRLTTWAAVAAAHAVERSASLAAKIKWPNDLELNGRKIAGILIETGTDRGGGLFAVLGIGLNVNQEAGEFPESIRATASSLRIASGRVQDRVLIAVELLRSLSFLYDRLIEGFFAVLDEARGRSTLLGHPVSLRSAGVTVEGIAEDLADDGRLLIRLGDGSIEPFSAGDASILRD